MKHVTQTTQHRHGRHNHYVTACSCGDRSALACRLTEAISWGYAHRRSTA